MTRRLLSTANQLEPANDPLGFAGAASRPNEQARMPAKEFDKPMRSASKSDLKSLRVAGFATCELILDLLYASSAHYRMDMESIWIILCVMQNTFRELINDPAVAEKYLNVSELPESVRPCMSRRAIADKTGLSRETVRRRTNKLINAGLLEEANGGVRLAKDHENADGPVRLNQINVAVNNYMKRIADYGIKTPF